MDYYYIHWLDYGEWKVIYENYKSKWDDHDFWLDNAAAFKRWKRGVKPYVTAEYRELITRTHIGAREGDVDDQGNVERAVEKMNEIIELYKRKIFILQIVRGDSNVRVGSEKGLMCIQIYNPFYYRGEEVVRFKDSDNLVWIEVDREGVEGEALESQMLLYVRRGYEKIQAALKRKEKMAFLYARQNVEKEIGEEGKTLPEEIVDALTLNLADRKRPRGALCLRCSKHPS